MASNLLNGGELLSDLEPFSGLGVNKPEAKLRMRI
jgi:hypothetical protein